MKDLIESNKSSEEIVNYLTEKSTVGVGFTSESDYEDFKDAWGDFITRDHGKGVGNDGPWFTVEVDTDKAAKEFPNGRVNFGEWKTEFNAIIS